MRCVCVTSVSPLPHHAGRGVAVGVHVYEGEGAEGGGGGSEDGVADQVVTPQAHWHTLVGEDRPEKDIKIEREEGHVIYLYCSVILSQAALTL